MEIARRSQIGVIETSPPQESSREPKIRDVFRRAGAYAATKLDRAISSIGSSGSVLDETMTPIPVPEPLLALPPISMPEPGPAKMLYNIAYEPTQRSHPLRTVAQTLFNRKGSVPEGLHGENQSLRLSGVIESQRNGTITSKPIFDAFKNQAVEDALAHSRGSVAIAPFSLKAIKMVRK